MTHSYRATPEDATETAATETARAVGPRGEEPAGVPTRESIRLAELVFSPYVAVRLRAAEHPAATLEALAILADDRDQLVRRLAEQRLDRLRSARRRAG